MQRFTALQYLELEYPLGFTDLATLASVPNVKLDLLFQSNLSHTAGSWQGLDISANGGFEISFADIDAFVRDNRNYLFTTGKTTKAWRSMHTAIHAASDRQRVDCFSPEPAKGSFPRRLSTDEEIAKSWSKRDDHVVCVEDVWPKESVQACLASAVAPVLKASSTRSSTSTSQRAPSDFASQSADSDSVSDSDSDSDFNIDRECLADHAGQLTFRSCLTWVANMLKSIRKCMHCVNCAVVLSPGEAET